MTTIYIDGVAYPIHKLQNGTCNTQVESLETLVPIEEYEEKVENLAGGVYDFISYIAEGNMFVSKEDIDEALKQRNDLNHELAILRIDIEKLLYGES